MKTKIIIIAENDVSSKKLRNDLGKEGAERIIKASWDIILAKLCENSLNNDRAHVESCELLDD